MSVTLARAALIFGLLAPLGCGGPARERSRLHSRNPVERATAAKRLGEWKDGTSIPALVGLLADDDHGVRLYAIQALRRITGQDYGYAYFADETERAAAIERWREALRRGEVGVTGGGVGITGGG